MTFPDPQWSNMRRAEIAAVDCSDWICILPLGAHEQHGPHLPFETDAIIASGIAERLVERVEGRLPVSVLPVEEVGYSPEHMDYAGSKTLSWDEAINRWISIGADLADLGIRKILLMNAHGGNSPLMTIVATEMRVRFDMLCVATSWTRFLEAGNHVDAEEKKFGIHGGEIETSVMLSLAPVTVDMSKAEDFLSLQQELTSKYDHLQAYGPHAFGWKMQDLNRQGVAGNASLATKEKGEKLLETALSGLETLVCEMHDFDLTHFNNKSPH